MSLRLYCWITTTADLRTLPNVCFKTCSTFVKRKCVTKSSDRGIGVAEGNAWASKADGPDSIPQLLQVREDKVFNKTTYQIPTNSMSTLRQKVRLNSLACFQPSSFVCINILYANFISKRIFNTQNEIQETVSTDDSRDECW